MTDTTQNDTPTEAQLRELVTLFYQRARAHDSLGTLFNTFVQDWEHHIDLVSNFWSRQMLGTERYRGHPFPVHMQLPIRREHFEEWLELFRGAARETLPAAAAKQIIGKAEFMADSFRAGLFPLDPPVRRSRPEA